MRFQVTVKIQRIFDIAEPTLEAAERARMRILNANKAEHRGSSVTVEIEQLPLTTIGDPS